MENKSSRKRYSKEFKLEAVRMSSKPGKTVAEVARELDIRENDLHTWRAVVKDNGEGAFPGSGRKGKKDNELAQLRRENKRLREERDILKKSAIFFARESKTDTDS